MLRERSYNKGTFLYGHKRETTKHKVSGQRVLRTCSHDIGGSLDMGGGGIHKYEVDLRFFKNASG